MLRKPVRFSMAGTMGLRSFKDVVTVARFVEGMGFSTFYASDHLHGVAGTPPDAPIMEPWTLTTALAPVTERLKLGVLVTGVTYRHPSMLAKICSTIDVISDGRLELGIGASWSKEDHLAYGIPFPPLAERQDRLGEAIELIQGMWTHERFTFRGRFYHVEEVPLEPKPVQVPHPPFLIAGTGDRTLEITARYGQSWVSVSTPAFAADCVTRLEEFCIRNRRDPTQIEYGQYMGLLLENDSDKVKDVLEDRMSTYTRSERRPAFSQVRSALQGETLEARAKASLLAGNPVELVEQIQSYVDVGITHIILMTPRPFQPETIEKFRKEVMAYFID